MDKNKFFEVMSSLQKNIRRGNEKVALKRAYQLIQLSGHRPLINRLKTILYEDVGVTSSLFLQARASLEDYEKMVGTHKDWVLALSSAIIAMSRSEKNRDACNLHIIVEDELTSGKIEPIEDYALDRHTVRGKQKGRNWDFFFQESVKCNVDKSNIDYKEKVQEAVKSLEQKRQNLNDWLGQSQEKPVTLQKWGD